MRFPRFAFLGLLVAAAASFTSFALGDDGAAPAPVAPATADPPAAPAADAWADVAVVKLRDAVAAKTVAAWGSDPQSYRAVKLHLRNKTNARVSVDIAGSYLEPKKRRSCQRLGLGPAVTPSGTRHPSPGTVIIDLEPGAETDLLVNTCCLDGGLPCPNKNEFEGSAAALPEVREKVLRWWADNPTAPQYAVNVAIWNFVGQVHLDPGIVQNYERPAGRFAAIHRGMYYRLVDGVLTTVDSEGVVRILGAEVFEVLPTDDGIYAVTLGEDRKPRLCVVPVTGEERWKKVLDLDGTNRIREVVSAGKGNLVLVTTKGVSFFDAASGAVRTSLESEQQDFLSVRRASGDRLTVTLRRPGRPGIQQGGDERLKTGPAFELWTLDMATGKAERAEKYWNIGAMLAGPGGVFALSHTQGRLRHLVGGDKWSDLGPETEYRKILAAAGDVVWLTDPEDRVVAVDAKSGAVRFRTSIVAAKAEVFDVDPATGDFACVVGDQFRWIRGADGREITVEPR